MEFLWAKADSASPCAPASVFVTRRLTQHLAH